MYLSALNNVLVGTLMTKLKINLVSHGNVVSSYDIDPAKIDTSANDELVDKLLVEYANKPSGNVKVEGV
jgi:hypothetical protein